MNPASKEPGFLLPSLYVYTFRNAFHCQPIHGGNAGYQDSK